MNTASYNDISKMLLVRKLQTFNSIYAITHGENYNLQQDKEINWMSFLNT